MILESLREKTNKTPEPWDQDASSHERPTLHTLFLTLLPFFSLISLTTYGHDDFDLTNLQLTRAM